MNKKHGYTSRNKGGDGRIVLWILSGGVVALILVGLIVVVYAVKAVANHSRKSAAFERISKTLDKFDERMTSREVSPLDPEYGGLYGGLPKDSRVILESVAPNVDSAAREIADDIEYVPDYCRNQAESGSALSSHRLARLSGLISHFPGDIEVEPLMRMPAGSQPYDAAAKLVHKRMSRDFLIQMSCADDDQIRQFSARVLTLSMPFGKLEGPGEMELAAGTSTVEKKQTFDRLYAAAHQAVEKRLVGRYRLRIDAVWKTAEEVASPVGLTTQQTIVEVSCTEKTWTIKLGDQVWSGVVDDLPNAKLSARISSIAGVSGLPGLRPDTDLSINGGEQGLAVDISSLARYSPMEEVEIGFSGSTTRYEPAKAGYERFGASLVRFQSR